MCNRVGITTTRTEIVIVRHHYEAFRASGTARIAGLALPSCRMIEAGPRFELADAEVRTLESAWLLLPGGSSLEQSMERADEPPRHLVLLDGTWREVRRMYPRLPALFGLPRVSLPPKEGTSLRLRHAIHDDQRSTLEALADALFVLEGGAVARPLLELHSYFVEQSLKARGVWPYRAGSPSRES